MNNFTWLLFYNFWHKLSSIIRTEGFSANHIPGKLGMRGSPTGDLHFENMKIHESCVLQKEGMGAAVLMSGLNIERILGDF